MIKIIQKLTYIAIVLFFSANTYALVPMTKAQSTLSWYKDAKFGMFIHFDIRGKRKEFNPNNLDTDEWARIAKQAGMKYIVPTTHQASYIVMWDSEFSKQDVTDLTPFKRDIIGELAASSKKQGLRMGAYYALADPINPLYSEAEGSDIKPYVEYLHTVVEELCQKHQPFLLWFDASRRFRDPIEKPFLRQQDMVDMLHSYGAISNSRLGDDDALQYVDYLTMNDNMAPDFNLGIHWESAVTITKRHGAWHYDPRALELKSSKELLHRLINAAGNGGNLLLNVGPNPQGMIPKDVEARLKTMGDWLQKNGEAIYETEAGPYPHQISWGSMTQKKYAENTHLYLNVVEWPTNGKFTLFGLKNPILEASLLATSEKVSFTSKFDPYSGHNIMTLDIPKNQPDENVSVIKLLIAGNAEMDQNFLQLTDGKVLMEAYNARIHDLKYIPNKPLKAIDMKMITVPLPGEGIMPGRGLTLTGFDRKGQALSWDFKLYKPGVYDVEVVARLGKNIDWDADDQVRVTVAGQTLENHLSNCENVEAITKLSESHCKIGSVTIAGSGAYSLSLELTSDFDDTKPNFRSVVLSPSDKQ